MQMQSRVRRLVPRQQRIQETEEQRTYQLSHVRQHRSGQGHHGPAVKTSKKKPIPEDYFVMGESAEQILRKLNKKIKKDYQDVGKNFAKEARKAHKGKRDQKFYGKPTKEETNKLLDEGIDLFAVPDYKDN